MRFFSVDNRFAGGGVNVAAELVGELLERLGLSDLGSSAPFGAESGKTKAQGVADAINRLLQSLIMRCTKGHDVLDRYHIGVVGYGEEIGLGFTGDLAGEGPKAGTALGVRRRGDQQGLGVGQGLGQAVAIVHRDTCDAVLRQARNLIRITDGGEDLPPLGRQPAGQRLRRIAVAEDEEAHGTGPKAAP